MALIIIPAAVLAAGAVARALTKRKAAGAKLGGLIRIGSADDGDAATVPEVRVNTDRPAPPEVVIIIRKLRAGQATTAEVKRAATISRLAGLEELAAKLDERAGIMGEVDSLFDAQAPTGNSGTMMAEGSTAPAPVRQTVGPMASGGRFQSPIQEATDDQWTRFVEALATGKPGVINGNGTLGRWGIDYRQLRDLGLVIEAKAREGGKGYTGVWKKIPGIDSGDPEKAFLTDEGAQYMALVQILMGHYKSVVGEWSGQIGGVLDRKDPRPISLSGLLGVARKTGISGLASWLAKEEDRKKFSQTTECFERCNGIF